MLSRRLALTLAFSLFSLSSTALADGIVNVYSYRQPALVEPLFKAFTDATGIEVRMVFAEKGLIERMQQEADLSPVDVLMTADVGRLVEAVGKGLSQPVISEAVKSKVPAGLRDANDQWFGLTMRARVIYASRDRVTEQTMSYEDLADPKWKGKICTRPGDHPYNLGLVGAMIAKRGAEATKVWAAGLKANLALKPNGSDRAQAKSVWAGECDLAIANTYYYGLMATNEKEPEQKEWAGSIKVLFPNANDRGSHVNISGMALAKYAPDKDAALKLMAYLASPEAQKIYAEQVFEYPVDPNVKPSELVASFGQLKADPLPLADIAANRKAASEMVDRVAFDDGAGS